MGQGHALRGAGRARCEDELEDLVRPRPLPRRLASLPVRWEQGVVGGRLRAQGLHGRGREPVQARFARIGGIAPGPEHEVPGLGRRDDPFDGSRRHPQVQGHEHEARGHRPVVRGRELRRGWRPRQDPVARLEVHRAQAPRRDPRPPLELAEAPLRSWSRRRAAGRGLPDPRYRVDRGVEQVQDGRHRLRSLPRARPRRNVTRRSNRIADPRHQGS